MKKNEVEKTMENGREKDPAPLPRQHPNGLRPGGQQPALEQKQEGHLQRGAPEPEKLCEGRCKGEVRCRGEGASETRIPTRPGASGPERISVAYGNIPAPGLKRSVS